MVVELALISIRPGREADFEAAFAIGAKIFAASRGYLSHELTRSIETPNRYALAIRWATLEDHTIGFRGSPAFPAWRAQVSPYFESAPIVEHYRPIAQS